MWPVAAIVARAVWRRVSFRREVFNKSWWRLAPGFIFPTWRSWPGSRKSCVRVDFYTYSLPSAPSRDSIRPLLPFCRRGCAEHLGIQRAMRTAKGERCGHSVCDNLAPPPRVSGWVSFTRREGSAIYFINELFFTAYECLHEAGLGSAES